MQHIKHQCGIFLKASMRYLSNGGSGPSKEEKQAAANAEREQGFAEFGADYY
jgi:hypothetical protein